MNLPVRQTRENAVIAGVCAGLAQRWKVDPNLLRIALILACLASGLGLVVYGVAVLVLPTEANPQPPVHRILPFTRTWPLPAVVGSLGVVGLSLSGVAGGWSGVGFLPVVIALGIWYATNRKRSQGRTVTADPTPFERAAEAWRDRLVEHQVNSGALPSSALAVAVSTPSPTPAYSDAATDIVPAGIVPARRRGRGLWWLALGLSVIGIVAVALLNGQGGLPYLAVMLISFGIALLVGTWRGRPPLLGVTTLVLLISTLITWAAPSVPDLEVAGGETRTYNTAADIPPEISAGVGSMPLDFTNLALTSDHELAISLGVGEIDIRLPEGVNSEVVWKVGLGDAALPDDNADGSSLDGDLRNVVDPTAPTLKVTVSLDVGSLEVTK